MQPTRAFLALWFALVALCTLYPVHNRTAILTTMGNDLANHVRHVHEAGLALREGQVPPLACPALDGGTRLPLFQYYSGTSYWIPAAWSLFDSNPYRALKLGIFLHVFFAGASVYGVVKMIAGRGKEGDERQNAKTPREETPRQDNDTNERRDAETQRKLEEFKYNSLSLLSVSASRRSSPLLGVFPWRPWRPGVHFASASFAALVAATAYQLAPFAAADLYSRGSYTEFAALHAAPGVLYCALRVVRSATRRASVAWICACGLAAAYFIPLHPVQTMLCGALIATVAAADALVDRRAGWRGLVKLAAAAALGVAGSAWFWGPVLRDYGSLRIVPHGAFLDAGLADPAVLLWPTVRQAATYAWTPQIGLHFAVAAVLVLVFRRQRRAAGITAAVELLMIVFVVLFQEKMPPVQRMLRPLQWSYRLLVPATLAGAVCVGLALTAILGRVGAERVRRAVAGVALLYVLGTSAPYFLGYEPDPQRARVRNVLAPTWRAPNSTGSYALRGTDYRELKFVRDDGTLNVDADIAIPAEGVATEVRIVLRRREEGASAPPNAGALRVGVGAGAGSMRWEGTHEPDGPSRVRMTFQFRPRVGHVAGDAVVRFEAPRGAVTWAVEDVRFRATADDAGMHCRLPTSVVRTQEGRETRFDVDVAPGREGLYQLSVFVLPSNEVIVNGGRVAATPSANRAMVVVPLRSGANVVKIRTRHSGGAYVVSLMTVTGAALGFAGAALTRRARSQATDTEPRARGTDPG